MGSHLISLSLATHRFQFAKFEKSKECRQVTELPLLPFVNSVKRLRLPQPLVILDLSIRVRMGDTEDVQLTNKGRMGLRGIRNIERIDEPKRGHNMFLLGGETIMLPRLGLLQKIGSRDLLPFQSLPHILDPFLRFIDPLDISYPIAEFLSDFRKSFLQNIELTSCQFNILMNLGHLLQHDAETKAQNLNISFAPLSKYTTP